MTTVRFVGYRKYRNDPTGHYPAFRVWHSDKLPNGAEVNCDTVRGLNLPVPEFPNYYQWVRDKFQQRVAIVRMLRNL